MFLGSYRTSFDKTSRRIALPIKIRDYLATSNIVLSYGFEKCIFGFDTKKWQQEANKRFSESLAEKRGRDLRRFIFSAAEHTRLDDQGRFVIPVNLAKFAKIERPIIVGAGDHFEIWDEITWSQKLRTLGEVVA